MRKINVRSPFYISGEEDVLPVDLPAAFYYHTATECGGATTVSVRSTTQLTNGQGIKVNGYGDTCFEVTGTLTETNETDVTFIYDTCDKCNGVPDYNYYTAELCAGGSPINVRSVDTLTVGQVIKAENYSADCYTITGSGSSNTNTVITLFNNCDHCATGIDYKYYDANSCDGTSSVVVRYEGALPQGTPVINVSGQGNKCFVLDGETEETSTNDIVVFYQNCTACEPIDPFTYYTATECGGSATVDFKSNEILETGSSVNLEGYGTTCYEVTGEGSVSGVAWTNKYTDCTACANANDPYNYFDAQKCDGTGSVIKIASINDLAYMQPRLWKVSGQNDICFSILSQTTSGGTVYNATEACLICPSDDPYKYWKAVLCGGTTVTHFRSLVDMTGKVVKFSGDNNCYSVTNEVFSIYTKDWTEIFDNCTDCEASSIQGQLKDVNLLTFYENNSLSGKTASQLDTEFKCLPCSNAVQYNTVKALNVPMAIGHQVYNSNGTKNTSLNGSFASISTATNALATVCNKGQIVFPLIYTFNNGVVSYVKAGTVNQCYSLPTTPENKALYCGETHFQGADAGRKLYDVFSNGVGDFTITITGDEVPCKFILKWNNAEQENTGYIGSNTYDDQLIAAGVPLNQINTGATSTKNATLTFNKTLAYPNRVQLEVFSPLVNDEYTVEVTECPPLQTPTFASNSYVNVKGLLYSYWGDSGDTYSPYTELQKTYDPFQAGSLAECLQPFFNYNAYTYVQYNSRVLGQTSNDKWLYQLCPTHPFYSAAVNHFFLDYSGEYTLDTSSGVNTWKEGIKSVREDLLDRNLENTYMIIYVVNPRSSAFAISSYNRLLGLLNTLITQTGEMGLKDVYDAGRLKVVYNVEKNQPVTYYRDIMADELNALNVGFNLTCG